jgi:hypothetical protein
MIAPKRVGDVSQAYFLAKCLEVGWAVSVPIGDCSRYDCVLDRGNGLERVQIKTGRLKNGAIVFSACSSTYHVPSDCKTKHAHNPYYGQIESFGVYCPDTKMCYIVPVDDVGIRMGALRIYEAKNKQLKGIRWAKDFEINEKSIYKSMDR